MRAFRKNSWQFKGSCANVPANVHSAIGNPPCNPPVGGAALRLGIAVLAHSQKLTDLHILTDRSSPSFLLPPHLGMSQNRSSLFLRNVISTWNTPSSLAIFSARKLFPAGGMPLINNKSIH